MTKRRDNSVKRAYGEKRDKWFPATRLNKQEKEAVEKLRKELGITYREFVLRGVKLSESEG